MKKISGLLKTRDPSLLASVLLIKADAIFARLGLIDLQEASAQLRAIELLDSRCAFFLR